MLMAHGKTTLEKIRKAMGEEGVNAVEIDMLYHTDRFYAAHDFAQCEPTFSERRENCLDLVPILKEVESNPNITMLWIDTKDQDQWKDNATGKVVLLADLADVIRAHVKAKPIWWGLGESGMMNRGDLEELVSRTPLPDQEGVSFDYGKRQDHTTTIQDLYLRARKAAIQNIGHSNRPGNAHHSCFEFNKAFAYLAEGKLSRVLGWTINDEAPLKGLYQVNGSTMTTCGGGEGDETQLIGAVDGIISDLFDGMRTQQKVIAADPTLRLATPNDVLWDPRRLFRAPLHHDNVLANGGAEMTPLPNFLASSWRLHHTHRSGVLSLTTEDCPGLGPSSGSRYFGLGVRCGDEATHMYQDVVVNAYRKEIMEGRITATVSASIFFVPRSLRANNQSSFSAFLTMEYYVEPNPFQYWPPKENERVTFDDVVPPSSSKNETNGTWMTLRGSVQLPSTARVLRVMVSAKRTEDGGATCEQPSWEKGSCPRHHLFVDSVALMVYPTITSTTSATPTSTLSQPQSNTVMKSSTSSENVTETMTMSESPSFPSKSSTFPQSHSSTHTTTIVASRSSSTTVSSVSVTVTSTAPATSTKSPAGSSSTSLTKTRQHTVTGSAPNTASPSFATTSAAASATATHSIDPGESSRSLTAATEVHDYNITSFVTVTSSLPSHSVVINHEGEKKNNDDDDNDVIVVCLTRRAYKVRLSGEHWALVLSANRTALTAALQRDIARVLNISSSRIEVLSLALGSLVVDLAITSDDIAEAELADSNGVLRWLLAHEVYVLTKKMYTDYGGPLDEVVTVLGVSVAHDKEEEISEPLAGSTGDGTGSPNNNNNNNNNNNARCGEPCLAAVVASASVVVAVALVFVGVFVWLRRRESRSEQKVFMGIDLDTI